MGQWPAFVFDRGNIVHKLSYQEKKIFDLPPERRHDLVYACKFDVAEVNTFLKWTQHLRAIGVPFVTMLDSIKSKTGKPIPTWVLWKERRA